MSNNRFAVIDTTTAKLSFQFLFISTSKYDRDWHSTLHTHPFTEIFYVTKGTGTFVTAGEHFTVQENDLVIVNPNTEHTEQSSGDAPLEYIAVGVQGLSFTLKDASQDARISFFNFKDYKKNVLFYLNTLVQEAQSKSAFHEQICHNLLEILLLHLLRNNKLTTEQQVTTRVTKEVATVANYLHHHYNENITLDDLANRAHISKYYLAHSFKEKFGVSVIDYLHQRRIIEAKTLLETTDYSMAQIASIVGFSNQSYFAKIFRKFEPLSPKAYRKQQRNKNESSLS